eukprot:814116-Amphidinium_carterae.1
MKRSKCRHETGVQPKHSNYIEDFRWNELCYLPTRVALPGAELCVSASQPRYVVNTFSRLLQCVKAQVLLRQACVSTYTYSPDTQPDFSWTYPVGGIQP